MVNASEALVATTGTVDLHGDFTVVRVRAQDDHSGNWRVLDWTGVVLVGSRRVAAHRLLSDLDLWVGFHSLYNQVVSKTTLLELRTGERLLDLSTSFASFFDRKYIPLVHLSLRR